MTICPICNSDHKFELIGAVKCMSCGFIRFPDHNPELIREAKEDFEAARDNWQRQVQGFLEDRQPSWIESLARPEPEKRGSGRTQL